MPIMKMLKTAFETVMPIAIKRPVRKWFTNRAYANITGKTTKDVFTGILETNAWSGQDSVSGPGSDSESTKNITLMLTSVIDQFQVKSMLDVPCGDFHWMQNVELGDCKYFGADIVQELIDRNNHRYANEKRAFRTLDIIRDPIPEYDLIFCRDCFIHLSEADILSSLRNFVRSGSKFVMLTTYPKKKYNWDCTTGAFRPLNLTLHPYNLPPPLLQIQENAPRVSEIGDPNFERVMALWPIDALVQFIDVKDK